MRAGLSNIVPVAPQKLPELWQGVGEKFLIPGAEVIVPNAGSGLPVPAAEVVNIAAAVHGETDKKIVLLEKIRPVAVNEQAVCLY